MLSMVYFPAPSGAAAIALVGAACDSRIKLSENYSSLEVTTMKRTTCALLLAVCWATCVRVQAQTGLAEFKPFVTQYVAAVNAKDSARLLTFYHPKTLTCITPETKDYYDGLMAMQIRDSIPANYTFTVSAVNENNYKALQTFGTFPLKPARELHIDYQQGDDVGSVILYMVQDNGRWLGDQPCASDETVKKFHDEAPERKTFEAEISSLAAGIKDPLRSELLALLRNHETAKAVDRYRAASGQDYRHAIFVINQLKTAAQ
jgi:hypothetical protein